jgi:ribosomal protein S18 acetylase RimI-like enzyme
MNIEILIASEKDLHKILDLQKICYQEEGRLHNDFNIPPLTQTIESIKDDFEKGTLFLKVVVENQLVGSVRGYSKNGTTNIGRLIVNPEFQNRKIGQTLMNAIENQLNDCIWYELFTGYKSKKNLAFYDKLGYVEFKRQFVHDNLILVYLEKQTT